MAIKCFVDALKNPEKQPSIKIPQNYFNSTIKDVTWCANSSVCSKESDLEVILERERMDFGYAVGD